MCFAMSASGPNRPTRKETMNIETRLKKLMVATPSQLNKIDAILDGRVASSNITDMVLLTISSAARKTGLSRNSVYRLIADGKLVTVPLRNGSRRIRQADLARLIANPE